MKVVSRWLTAAGLLLWAPAALSAADQIDPLGEPYSPDRYERCIRKAVADPEEALFDARQWFVVDRSEAAKHCEAKALIELDFYTDGAAILSNLALNASPDQRALKGALFAQAGNAWLLADDAEAALAAFDAAAPLLPDDPELLLDRARALADLGQLTEAVLELDQALILDVANSAALLERARLFLAAENWAAAKRDLLMVLELAPNTSLAKIAREALEALPEIPSSGS